MFAGVSLRARSLSLYTLERKAPVAYRLGRRRGSAATRYPPKCAAIGRSRAAVAVHVFGKQLRNRIRCRFWGFSSNLELYPNADLRNWSRHDRYRFSARRGETVG